MAEDFGLKIALQGEREFRKALTDINASFKVLGSEMKLVDAQFKRSDDAQAKYAAKGRVLAEQISAQREKISTLEAALKNAATNFGETDRRTLAWQTQLNNAKAVLTDLEGELEDNNKALAKFGDNADGAGDNLADAAKGTDRLEGEVDDLGDELTDTGKKALSFGDVLKANLASEAIVAGVKGIGRAIASIGRGFAGALRDGVAYNAKMETYTASFTTMLGDEAAAPRMSAALAVSELNTAVARRNINGHDVTGCIVHSDRASQFRSNKYLCALKNHGLKGSMGKVAAAEDNAAMESFFSLLQRNVLNTKTRANREELTIEIITWIERRYYQHHRQQRLARLTPLEYETINHKAAQKAA